MSDDLKAYIRCHIRDIGAAVIGYFVLYCILSTLFG